MNTKTKKHRLFIGAPLSLETKDIIKSWISQLPTAQIRWTSPENYHLTIEFLGMIEAEKIETINQTLQKIIPSFKVFAVKLDKWIFFPNATHPKIISVYVSLTEELGKLRAQIHQALAAANFILEDRPYLPHITIGRCRDIKLDAAAIKNPETSQSFFINQVVLYESVQINSQSTYLVKSNFDLHRE